MPQPQEPLLEFDELAIDFAGRRLLRDGQPLALERKAFEVLALLAAAPGIAFTRDQILDAVWGHRHVTPGVLNRVMTLLRHALGEEANAPRYLHTLHGVGYRFDLPQPTLAEAHAVRAARPDEVAPAAPPAPTGARSGSKAGRIAAALLGLFALAMLGWWGLRDRVAPLSPAVAPPPTLIVMPLKPIGGQAGAREIAAGLSEELISELARIDGLRVIARESTALAADEGTPLAELLPRLGITHAVEGSLRQTDEAMRVTIRLTDIASGRALWSRDFDRQAPDVLALQREIAQAVAAALALKLTLAPAPRGGDAEFLRRYFAAHALNGLTSRLQGDKVERAESEFRALVYQRPQDARVHAGLAVALEARAFQHPDLGERLREEAAREAAIALQLDPDQFEAQGVQAAAACRAEAWERCTDLYEQALSMAPSNSPLRFQYTMVQASLGYLDRAEALARAGKARDPLNRFWNFALARILDTLGRHDEALAEFRTIAPNSSPYGPYFNAVWRGDLAGAASIARGMDRYRGDDEVQDLQPSYELAAAALADPRRWPEAKVAMRKWEADTGLMNFLRVFAPGEDRAALLEDLATARRRSYSTWDLLVWSRALRPLREDPAFQGYLADHGILAYWKAHGFPSQCTPRDGGVDCL